MRSDIELKSIRIFLALVENPSVTFVAQKMGMQRPSITYHLNKLREEFNDPLFVQVGRDLQATQRANRLAPKLAIAVTALEEAISEETFAPHKVERCFRIAMQDSSAAAVIPQLIKELEKVAPNISIDLVNWPQNAEQKLLDGEIDLAINAIAKLNNQLHGFQLGSMPMCAVMSSSHPLSQSKFDVSRLFEYPHVRVKSTGIGENHVDELADALGKDCKVVLHASTFTVLTAAIHQSNLIGVLPLAAAFNLPRADFCMHVLPEIPAIPFHCFWHQRLHHDKAHKLVRSLLIDVSRRLKQEAGI